MILPGWLFDSASLPLVDPWISSFLQYWKLWAAGALFIAWWSIVYLALAVRSMRKRARSGESTAEIRQAIAYLEQRTDARLAEIESAVTTMRDHLVGNVTVFRIAKNRGRRSLDDSWER